MLAFSLSGEMHAGDSMGVWTFGQKLRPGDCPLQTWDPDKAAMIASNLVNFVDKQSYAKSPRFDVLQPVLNEVVSDSERLTVLIFCSGDGTFSGTPFDALSPAAAAAEFEASRERLEEAVDRPVRHFAFPRGRYRRGQLTLGAAAGYRVFHGARIGAHRPASLVPGSVLNRVPVLPGLDTDEFIGYALAAPLHLLRGRLAAEGRRVARAASRAAAALLAPLAGCGGRGS